jgi:hypothetical protein
MHANRCRGHSQFETTTLPALAFDLDATAKGLNLPPYRVEAHSAARHFTELVARGQRCGKEGLGQVGA